MEQFDRERNRLGGLLLLKGKDNIPSSNETFEDKLRTYDNTLYWNETLREDFYANNSDFEEFNEKFALCFKPMKKFGPAELEQRHQLLYKISKIIWK